MASLEEGVREAEAALARARASLETARKALARDPEDRARNDRVARATRAHAAARHALNEARLLIHLGRN